MAGRRLVAEPVVAYAPEADIPLPPPAPPEEFIERPVEEDRRVVGEIEVEEQVTELTAEERANFVTLMTCGKRTKVIEVLGHQVGIESLNNDDDLRIGLYTKDYRESDAFSRAVHIGTCAAGIRTIDGRPLYTALSTDETPEAIFQEKVTKLLKFYPISITEIYREILKLDLEFAELATKLGKLRG